MENLAEILADNNYYEAELVKRTDDEDLPAAWKAIIGAEAVEEKKRVLQTLWRPFAGKLPLTTSLIDQLLDAVVVKENGECKLVYLFDVDDITSAYTGRLPVNDGPFLDQLPDDLAEFYKTVHNGWFENISGGLGFLSLQDIELLGDHEWGILEELPPLDFDLAKTFAVFHNAGGGYLCFNLTDPKAPECLIFWTTKEPKRNLNFWAVIDSWIEIGLTN